MKLILVLLVLISRELVTPAWRSLLTSPSYWWRDMWLNIAIKHKLSASLVLGLLSLLPVIAYGILFLFLQKQHVVWQFLWGAIILVSVFIDRRLPTILAEARQNWVQIEQVAEQELAETRSALFDSYLKELFAPLFWIFLLNWWGVLLVSVYYSCRICAEQEQHLLLKSVAEKSLCYLNWLPSRALALSFALVGQFMPVWQYWSKSYLEKVSPLTLVEQSAYLAEMPDINVQPSQPQHWLAMLAGYESLCFRVVVFWVILLVLQLM